MELYDKFLVLKRTDIDSALTPAELHTFQELVAHVAKYRARLSKPENRYVVINQDEPYFPAVLALMEGEEQP